MLNQAQFMREYNEKFREDFNPELFKRDSDEIIEAIRQVVLSCERDKYYTLKLQSFEVIYDYEKIYDTLRNHEEKRRKKKNTKVENTYDYINIRDTDIILIKIEWYIRHNGSERVEEDGGSSEIMNPEEIMEVLIAIPRFVKNYYFRLSGNLYNTIFQIVDGSTYNNSTASQSKVDTVTLKTMFMPIRIFRGFNEKLRDVATGVQIKAIEYQSIIFNTTVNVLYYIFAAYGFLNTAQFLGIDCVYVSNEPRIDDNYYNFEKNGIYITVFKKCFDEDHMVQTLVSTIYSAIHKDATVYDLYDQHYWLSNLGMAFKNPNPQKGLFVLDSIEGIYDNATRENLHLPMKDKENIYCVLRWLMREFSNLRIKENTDVRTKRIRIAEYVAAIYAAKLSKAIVRISDMGSKVTLKKVCQAIYTNPMYIITNISGATMSNLVSYNDLVNDLDSLMALKYTYKGISGLGEDGTAVQPVYRYVDPSHVGILDLDASSASDPGMSGIICPMTQLYGKDMSFSEYEEPNDWRDTYKPLWQDYNKDCISPFVTNQELKLDCYYRRDDITKECLEIEEIVCPIYNVNDPSITYTRAQDKLNQQNKEYAEKKSLFTIE